MDRKQLLATHQHLRQEAVARFPLMAAGMAQDLKRLCDLRRDGVEFTQEATDAAQYLEDKIRECYREVFGTELGT